VAIREFKNAGSIAVAITKSGKNIYFFEKSDGNSE